jgi:hypothetical protein
MRCDAAMRCAALLKLFCVAGLAALRLRPKVSRAVGGQVWLEQAGDDGHPSRIASPALGAHNVMYVALPSAGWNECDEQRTERHVSVNKEGERTARGEAMHAAIQGRAEMAAALGPSAAPNPVCVPCVLPVPSPPPPCGFLCPVASTAEGTSSKGRTASRAAGAAAAERTRRGRQGADSSSHRRVVPRVRARARPPPSPRHQKLAHADMGQMT